MSIHFKLTCWTKEEIKLGEIAQVVEQAVVKKIYLAVPNSNPGLEVFFLN